MVQCHSICSFNFLLTLSVRRQNADQAIISSIFSSLAALWAMLLTCFGSLLFCFTVNFIVWMLLFCFFLVQFQEEGRMKVREALTPQTMQSALRRVLPFPCRNQYTVVILMPKSSCWASVKSMLSWSSSGVSRDAKVRIGLLIYFQHLAFLLPVVKKSSSWAWNQLPCRFLLALLAHWCWQLVCGDTLAAH